MYEKDLFEITCEGHLLNVVSIIEFDIEGCCNVACIILNACEIRYREWIGIGIGIECMLE